MSQENLRTNSNTSVDSLLFIASQPSVSQHISVSFSMPETRLPGILHRLETLTPTSEWNKMRKAIQEAHMSTNSVLDTLTGDSSSRGLSSSSIRY